MQITELGSDVPPLDLDARQAALGLWANGAVAIIRPTSTTAVDDLCASCLQTMADALKHIEEIAKTIGGNRRPAGSLPTARELAVAWYSF
jgi:hypothetical protein